MIIVFLTKLTRAIRCRRHSSIISNFQSYRFLQKIDEASRLKILENIDKARYALDPKLLKKLTGEIWEFRTKYAGIQYRLLAFWDKRDSVQTLVIATHGFKKKTQKTPKQEIDRAIRIRSEYYEE